MEPVGQLEPELVLVLGEAPAPHDVEPPQLEHGVPLGRERGQVPVEELALVVPQSSQLDKELEQAVRLALAPLGAQSAPQDKVAELALAPPLCEAVAQELVGERSVRLGMVSGLS